MHDPLRIVLYTAKLQPKKATAKPLKGRWFFRLEDMFRTTPVLGVPACPVFTIVGPELLSSDGTLVAGEPLGLVDVAVDFALSPFATLLFFDAVLLVRSKVILAVLHGPLVGTQSRIGGGQPILQAFGESVESDDEGGQIERHASGTSMGLPHQERLGRLGVLAGDCGLEAGGVTGIDFVIPAAADTPFG